MKHTMKLKPAPFFQIKEGKKTIELRLYDEKRQLVSVGDIIDFVNTDNEEDMISTMVEELYVFDTFDELYKNLPLLECGYTEENVPKASSADMEKYYSKEEQSRYGVVGIKVKVF